MMRKLMSACAVLLAMALPLMAQTPACSVLVYPRFVAPNSTTGTPGTGTPVALFAKFVPSAATLPDTFAFKFRGGDALTRGVTWLPIGDFNAANGDTGSWFGDAAAYATGTRQLYFTDANPQQCWIQGKVLNTSTAGPDTFRLRFRVLPATTNYDSPVYEVTALNMTTNGGWIEGNVYSDAGFTSGHQRRVVLAYKADTIAGIYISEGNRIKDTYDSTSAGYFKVAVPVGSIDSIQVRDTLNNIISSYTRTSPSWVINAGQVTNINGDIIPPTITGTSPSNGVTEVALDAQIWVAFSEPVDTLTLAGGITPSPNESPVWNASMDTLFLPHDPMSMNTVYNVKLTALNDLAGNPLAVLPDSFMFTTTVGDTIKPYIVSSYPADGDSNVARDATICLAFSEPIDPASFDGYSSPDLMMSLSWSAGGDTVWLDPDTLMAYNLNFTLICTSATDLAGNPLAVLPDSFSFTTVANLGPVITQVQQPSDTYDGSGPFLVRAVITDPGKAGITADTLWYSDSHQAVWWAVTHSAIDGDTFSYSIPGPFASGMVIEYFFGAWDDGGSASYEPSMYRGYQFRILDPLPPESLTAIAGDQQVDLAWIPPAEILDYSAGNGTGLFLSAGDISNTRFTPQHYPCKVEQAVSSWWYAAGSDSVEVHVWADDGAGLPDRSVDLVPPRVVMPLDYPNYTVVDFSSDNLVLSSGDFHVGYVIRSDNHPMPLCDGDGPGLHSTMYDSSAGSWDMVWNSDDYNDWSHQAAVSYSSYSKGLKLKSYVLKSGDKPLTKLAGLKAMPVTSKQATVYPELQGALFLAKNIYDYTILRATTSGGPYTVVSSSGTPTYVDSAVFNGTQYFYVVRATYTQPDTFSAYSNEVSATPLGVEGKPGDQTHSFFLSPASPNPVKSSAEFRFGLAQDRKASLEIYNVLGQRVKTLLSGQLPAGNHTVKWNGCDEEGRKVSSGVYVYRLNTGDRTLTRRLTVIR